MTLRRKINLFIHTTLQRINNREPLLQQVFAQWEKGERFSSKNGHWETVRNLSAETLACMDHYHPSPKPTFCPKWEVSVNVDLREGYVGSFPATYHDPPAWKAIEREAEWAWFVNNGEGGGEPSLSLMHPLHFLHAQNPFQQVSFQTLAIKAILTWKWPPLPHPTFFSVLSIFWPAKKENKGEEIDTLHYRLTGHMFLRSITCNSPCFWWPQASVFMFFITNYIYLLLW